MSQTQSNQPKEECKCIGDKKVKALEKQIAELTKIVETLSHKVEIIERVLKR